MAAPALDPYADPRPPMGHLMDAPPDPRLTVPGLDAPLPTGTFAAKQAQDQRAFQQQGINTQEHALQLQKEQDHIAASLRASQYATDPATRGKAFYELTPEQQQQASGTSTAAPEIPGLINAAQSAATGRPVGANILPGETATSKIGETTISGMLPRGQSGIGYDDLPENEQKIVDAIADYKLPMPSGGGFPPAQRARIISALTDKYGPDSATPYNAAEFPARQSALTDFKSGASSKNITSLNTAIKHIAGLSDSGDRLGNSAVPFWNTIANPIAGQLSDKRQAELTDFNTRADGVASELGRVFAGSAPAMSQIKEWRNSLGTDLSPKAQKSAISAALEMLNSRLSSLQDQWDKGVKNDRDIPFLNPESRALLDNLAKKGIVNANHIALDPVTGEKPVSTTIQPTQLSPQDKVAIDWANANPNNPRAAKIKALNGIQ